MRNDIFKALKKEFPGIRKNVLLANHTTFKIGGPAEYFLIVKSRGDLLKAVELAKLLKLPVFFLGGGSNLLVSDEGIKGLVVKNRDKGLIVSKSNNVIEASAGIILEELVELSIKKSLKGLEWAGGLPGTFGGAIRGNAGAFGGEIKDSILEVRALDNKFNLRKLSRKQCHFSYRSSIFKEKNWIVLSASVKLKRGSKKELEDISRSHVDYRRERHPLEYPNAGSIFKNVDFKEIPLKIRKLFLDKVKKDPFPIVPSAWFIIGAGLAGKRIGRVQVSEKHSNYIVNLGGATAKDVLFLIKVVKNKVKEKYNINLETEVQFVGF